MDFEQERKKFLEIFNNIGDSYKITPIEGSFGITVKIKSDIDSENISSIDIYIPDSELTNQNNIKKLKIHAIYGKESNGGGVYLRSNPKINEPIDLAPKNYNYRISDGKIFYKNKELSSKNLIDKIYKLHIITTKKLKGLKTRIKLFILHVLMMNLFYSITKIFYFVLLLISGDRYSYEPILKTEKLNDKILSSSLRNGKNYAEMKEDKIESKQIDFLGYKIDYWPIVAYSVINLAFYFYFELINFKPKVFVIILNNNFLTLIYVILSLWIMEAVFPFILKWLIRISSKLSVKFGYKISLF